jgi:hypothetical protein
MCNLAMQVVLKMNTNQDLNLAMGEFARLKLEVSNMNNPTPDELKQKVQQLQTALSHIQIALQNIAAANSNFNKRD